MAKKETTPKSNKEGKKLKDTVSSVVSSRKPEDKSESTKELVAYLKENFPIFLTLITDIKKTTEASNKEVVDKLVTAQKLHEKNKDQNAQIQTKLENSRKLLSAIDEKLGHANKQREESANLEEERIAEEKKEKAFLEEKRAEMQEKQNAEIITKLSALDETFKNLDIGGGAKASGKGLFGSLMDMLSNGLKNLLPLAMNALKSFVPALASLASAIFTNPAFMVLAAAALGAGAGYLLWKKWLEPLMEKEFAQKSAAISQQSSFVTEQSTNEEGKKLFVETDSSGITRILSETDLAERAGKEGKTTEEYTTQQLEQGNLRKLTYKKDFTGKIIEGQETYTTGQQQEKAQQLMAKSADVKEEVDQRAMGEILTKMFKDKDFSKLSKEDKEAYAKQALSNYAAITGKQLSAEQTIGLENQFKKYMEDEGTLKVASEISERQLRSKSIDNIKEDIQGLHARLVSALTGNYASEDEATVAVETAKGLIIDIGKKLLPQRADKTLKAARYEGLTETDIEKLYEEYPLLQHFMRRDGQLYYKIMKDEPQIVIKDALMGVLGGYKPMEMNGKWSIGTTTGVWPFTDKNVSFSQMSDVDSSFPSSLFDSLKNIPQLAEGGVVIPKSDAGVFANISENMKPEAIVPLDKYVISEKPEAINMSEKATMAMRNSYFEEKEASQTSQAPLIINNVNNTKGTTSSGDGVNFQYQTDLARTFDTVFEMILEKNMRTGIA
jgi:hypothetical protein